MRPHALNTGMIFRTNRLPLALYTSIGLKLPNGSFYDKAEYYAPLYQWQN